MNEGKLTLIARGCNSQLFTFGSGNDQVVLKVVPSVSKKEQRHLFNEFSMLKQLHHNNILRVLKYQENVAFAGNKSDSQKKHTSNVLVLEFANKGSLLQHIQKETCLLNQKRDLFKDVVEGVRYLHEIGIAHRDLKLQNVLVFQENEVLSCKISDFGFASFCKKQGVIIRFGEYKGTKKGYMAPQVHNCLKNPQNKYDAMKVDIFALGVILFAIVFKKLPFEFALKQNALFKLLIEKNYSQFWAYHHQIELLSMNQTFRKQQFMDLFQKMVCFQSQERLTAQQVRKHHWMHQ